MSSVLVVENYTDLRSAVVSALARAHYTCDGVDNSMDAVARMREHHYSTILLSPRLPIAEDPVMLYLHDEQPGQMINVILMTEPGQESGECRNLVKPFNKEELIAKMSAKF